MAEEMDNNLDEAKKSYENVRESYGLPGWKNLEEDFDVSKAFSSEGGLILREIRRKMNEKIASYLHLFETFINPQSSPMFIMNVLKNLEEKEWENVRRIYKELAKIQFKQILVDTIYSEEKEAGLIKEVFEIWEKEKKGIVQIVETLGKKYEENTSEKKKTYFG